MSETFLTWFDTLFDCHFSLVIYCKDLAMSNLTAKKKTPSELIGCSRFSGNVRQKRPIGDAFERTMITENGFDYKRKCVMCLSMAVKLFSEITRVIKIKSHNHMCNNTFKASHWLA